MSSALLLAFSLAPLACAKGFRITVAASDTDRAAQLVTFKAPAGFPRSGVLTASDGSRLPLQAGADDTASFLVPVQKAGDTLVFTAMDGKGPTPGAGIEVKKGGGQLHVMLNGAPLFDYQMDKDALPRPDIAAVYKRAGYLHPIYAPSGVIVSDDYPAQHIHHHGIWAPWTKTIFQGRDVDFWNMGAKKGTVEFVGLDRTWNGPVHGGFVSRQRFVDLSPATPVVVLNETWVVTAYALPGDTARVFDLVLHQECATNDPLILPKYHYGGLGVRGRGEWLGVDKAHFLTSEGETDRVKADEQKMRWVHLSGAVEGGVAGIAVLGHPENFRAPQPVRVHPKEPYVSFTPSWEGPWEIAPGQPYTARYRLVVADGAPDRQQLDAFWNAYALPARVTVEAMP
jgi:hypothetical protein